MSAPATLHYAGQQIPVTLHDFGFGPTETSEAGFTGKAFEVSVEFTCDSTAFEDFLLSLETQIRFDEWMRREGAA